MATAKAKITSFKAACKALKLDPETVLPEVENSHNGKALLATAQLLIIVEAMNEGWKPNWKDYDEAKYYPWFEMDSDKGFRLYSVSYYSATSLVGSRLCFRSRDLAEYAAKKFFSLYKDMMT